MLHDNETGLCTAVTWYNGLSRDTVSPVINHHRAQCVQSFNVGACVRLHTLQVTSLLHTTCDYNATF